MSAKKAAKHGPVIIEAAINGTTTKERNPNAPRASRRDRRRRARVHRCRRGDRPQPLRRRRRAGPARPPTATSRAGDRCSTRSPTRCSTPRPTSGRASRARTRTWHRSPRPGWLRIGIIDPGSVNLGGVGRRRRSPPRPASCTRTRSATSVTRPRCAPGCASGRPWRSSSRVAAHRARRGTTRAGCRRARWSSSTSVAPSATSRASGKPAARRSACRRRLPRSTRTASCSTAATCRGRSR